MNYSVLAGITVSLTVTLTAATLAAQGPDTRRLAAVADSVARTHLEFDVTPGMSIAIAKDGRLLLERGYGDADVEMDVSATPTTIYRIASITKQFTSAAIMRLVESGAISLDDPVTKHLPDFPTQGHTVTVRHLLNHTSGIKSHTGIPRAARLEASHARLLELIGEQPFDFAPGQRYSYNNSGYVLLSAIIEKVTGASYGDYVERELLKPLGLTQTLYCQDNRIIPNRAHGYGYDTTGIINTRNGSILPYAGDAAFCSTVGDLVQWTHLLHSGRVVSSASLQQMLAPTTLPSGNAVTYGFGLDLARLEQRPKVQHGGEIEGYVSVLSHYPAEGLTIAVLTNSHRGKPEQVEEVLARTALGMKVTAPLDLPLSADELARYTGTYTVMAGRTPRDARIYVDGGRLMMMVANDLGPLRYQGNHVFTHARDSDVRVTFSDVGARAAGIRLEFGGRAFEGKRKEVATP